MKTYIPQIVIATMLLSTAVAYPQCTGSFCRPVDPWASAGPLAPALDSGAPAQRVGSTLDSCSHCRISVGDGKSSSSTVGSGTLVSKNGDTGLVLTCSHLFDTATSNIVVTFPNGDRFGARLVDRDRAHDLAALLIRVPTAAPLSVDESDPVGILTACGYGGDGRFQGVRGTITGAAQAIGAAFPSLKIGGAVRPGDSGGGVLNAAGQLVGIVWGCRDGETYFTCGKPLRNFLSRILPRGERASARGPSAPTLDADAWRTETESRLTRLETNKQNRGDYIERNEFTTLLTTQSTELEQSATTRIDSLKTIVFDRIEQRVSTITPGLLSGLSTGKLIAAALGLSGPVALAVVIASGLAGRRVKRRINTSSNSQPSTIHTQPLPIAIDTPPPPQQIVPESHYVPIQRDDFARAHQWAREQVARKYPGATEVLSTLESLIKQQLAGAPHV